MLITLPFDFTARRLFRLLPFALVFLLVTSVGSSFAAEPWAGKDLPVSDGLAFWLDAKVQPEAWQSHQTRGVPLTDGGAFDIWFDGSGHKRHLFQRRPQSQPSYRLLDGHAYVSFDGEEDFLSSTHAGRKVEEITIFLFAAPEVQRRGISRLVGSERLRAKRLRERNQSRSLLQFVRQLSDIERRRRGLWRSPGFDGRGFSLRRVSFG